MRIIMFLIALTIPLRMISIQVSSFEIRIIDIIIMIGLLIMLVKLRVNDGLKNKGILLIPIIIFVYGAISVVWSEDELFFYSELIRLFLAIGIFVLVYLYMSSENESKIIKLLKFQTSVAAVVGIVTIVNVISKSDVLLAGASNLFTDVRSFYELKFANSIFFEDPNNYAAYLMLNWFVVLFLRNEFSKKKFMLLNICYILAILLTLSRGAIIALLCVFIFVAIKHMDKRLLISIFPLVIGSIVSAVIDFYNYSITDISFMSRFDFLTISVFIIKNHFVFGTGIGNFPYYYQYYLPLTSVLTIISAYNPYAHNIYLKILAEMGIIGLSLHVILIIKIYLNLISIIMLDKRFIFLGMGIAAYLIQGLTVEFYTAKHFWFYLAETAVLSMRALRINRK